MINSAAALHCVTLHFLKVIVKFYLIIRAVLINFLSVNLFFLIHFPYLVCIQHVSAQGFAAPRYECLSPISACGCAQGGWREGASQAPFCSAFPGLAGYMSFALNRSPRVSSFTSCKVQIFFFS